MPDRRDRHGGISAGPELLELPRVVASPGVRRRLHDPGVLPPDRPHPRGRQVPPRVLRRSPRDAGPVRRRLRRVGAPRGAGGEDGPDPRPLGDGRGDDPAGARRDLLHHVLRAVPRRADVRDARPHDRGTGRLERGDLAERLRGRELRRRWGRRPRHALRPRRRVRRGGARTLEGVGAGRHRPRPGGRRVRGPVEGAPPRPPRPVLPLPRTVHGAAVAAGSPGQSSRPGRAGAGGRSRCAGPR